jgi:hypothetical protein
MKTFVISTISVILLPFFSFLNINLFAQYSEVWKGNFNNDENEKICYASKVKIAADKNLICISSIGFSQKTFLTFFDLEGNFIKEFRPFYLWLPFNDNSIKDRHELFQSESKINKFDIDILSDKFMYFNVGRTKNADTSKLFHYSINYELKDERYAQNRYISNRENSYTALLANGNNLFIADTIWMGFNKENSKIQHYLLTNQTVDPYYFNKPLLLSPDTISADKSIANPVPIAIKRTKDSNLVIVIASEEQPSSEPVGVSLRIVNKKFQEIKRFSLSPELFNLNGKLLSIKDAVVSENSIFLIGKIYSENSSSIALISKVDFDGSNFICKHIPLEETTLKSIKFLDYNSIITVGSIRSDINQSKSSKLLVEFSNKLDIRNIYKWVSLGLDTLFDIEPLNDKEFIVVGSENGKQFASLLKKNFDVSSVENTNKISMYLQKNPKILIEPNPIINESALTIFLESKEKVYAQLFDINGVFIKDVFEPYYPKSLEVKIKFNTNDLVPGVYVITVEQGESINYHKIIVQ